MAINPPNPNEGTLDMSFMEEPQGPEGTNVPEAEAPIGTEDFDGVDPSDDFASGIDADYDPEEAIYGINDAFDGIVAGITQVAQMPGQALQGAVDYGMDPQRGDDLGNFVSGLQGVAKELPIDSSGSAQNLLSEAIGGIGQAARAVGGGAAEAVVESANFLDEIISETHAQMASRLTGTTVDQIKANNPVFTAMKREIPSWLKPQGDLEGTFHTLAQWYGPFKAFGTVGKLPRVAEALGVVSGNLSKLPAVSTAMAEMSNYPKLGALVKTVKDALAFEGADLAANMSAFGAHEENLANILSDAVGDNPLLAGPLWKALSSKDTDEALMGRLKNGLVSQFGSSVAGALFNSVKILKALKGVRTELKQGGMDRTKISGLLGDLEMNTREFQAEVDAISNRDPQELLDEIFNNPSGAAKAAGGDGTPLLTGRVEETVEMGTDMVPTAAGDSAEAGAEGANPKGLVEIHHSDSVEDAAQKVLDAEPQLDSEQIEAIREMLQAKMDQTNANFDVEGFQAAIDDALTNDMPIDIHQELERAIGDAALENVDAFKALFPEVTQATVKGVKRYVSNEAAVDRAVSIFGFDPGIDKTTGTLKKQLDVFDDLNAVTIQIEILKNKQNEAAVLYGQVKNSTDESVKASAMKELARWKLALDQSQFHRELILSEAGRLLQAGKIKITDGQVTAAHNNAIMEAVAKAKRNLPIFAVDGNEGLSEAEANMLGAVALELNGRGTGPGAAQKAARHLQMFMDSAMGRVTFTGPLGALYGAGFGGAWGGVTGSVVTGTTSAAGAIAEGKDPFEAYRKGSLSGFNAGWDIGLGVGGLAGGTAGLAGGSKGLKFTLGATQEIFYNNVLAHFNTLKGIGFSNALLKTYESGSTAIGAMAAGDAEQLARSADESGAFIRYMTEGIGAGLSVLAKGERHAYDYATSNPRIISKDGLRQYFGSSAGDALKGTPFESVGNMSDKVVDAVGKVVNIPTGHLIGGMDTAFKVANMRALLYTELKAKARVMGKLDSAQAHAYAVSHLDAVTDDLIKGRSAKFAGYTPNNTEFSLKQLSALNSKIIGSTDQFSLSHPLKKSESAFGQSDLNHSDRWLFQTGAKFDDLARQFGVAGTYSLPFAKTYFNSVQYGIDGMPLVNMLSPYNRMVMAGEMGLEAKHNLQGKTILGTFLAVTGMGLALTGAMAPPSGSAMSTAQNKTLTGEGPYTLRIPVGEGKNATLRFDRSTPIADMFFTPARLTTLAYQTADGTIDPGAGLVGAIAMGTESFSTSRFMKGMTNGVDSLLNTSYSTPDALYRNIIVQGLGAVVTPGGRAMDNVNMFTDPAFRDYNDLKSYVESRTIGVRTHVSPMYDPFGMPRPNDDYIGSTQNYASNLVRGLTPWGIRYTPNDKLSQELARFSKNGYTLSAPVKNVSLEGVTIPLDRYRNDKGESLWDHYNKHLRETPLLSPTSKAQLTLRDVLNQVIETDDYKNGQDNQATRVTGKTNRFVGSRWAEIQAWYQEAKDAVGGKEGILWSPENLRNFKDENGDSLETDLQRAKMVEDKTKGGTGQPQ